MKDQIENFDVGELLNGINHVNLVQIIEVNAEEYTSANQQKLVTAMNVDVLLCLVDHAKVVLDLTEGVHNNVHHANLGEQLEVLEVL